MAWHSSLLSYDTNTQAAVPEALQLLSDNWSGNKKVLNWKTNHMEIIYKFGGFLVNLFQTPDHTRKEELQVQII